MRGGDAHLIHLSDTLSDIAGGLNTGTSSGVAWGDNLIMLGLCCDAHCGQKKSLPMNSASSIIVRYFSLNAGGLPFGIGIAWRIVRNVA